MSRLVDLSHRIENGMTTYPGLPGPVIADHLTREDSRRHYGRGTEFHIGRIQMVANTGTYLDTPFHRYPTGYDLADVTLETIADVPGVRVTADAQAIEPEACEHMELTGRAVLFFTGWDRHWRTERYGDPDHPYLTEESAALLVERGARLVGIDSVNIDDTGGTTRPVHSRLLEAGIPLVEHLTGLGAVGDDPFRFFAVPPAVRGLGTFPVRAFALLG
jgi:arylformamidase